MSSKNSYIKDLSLIHMSPYLSTVFHKRQGIRHALLFLKTLVYDIKVQMIAGMV